MLTTFYRIIKYGLHNFSRNYLVSIATILVLLIAVIVFTGLMMFGVTGNQAMALLQDKIDISVDFRRETTEDAMLALQSSLRDLAEVKEVEYVSREEALIRFRATHPPDSDVIQAIDAIGDNPLLASLNIKALHPRYYSVIAAYLNNETLSPIIEKVSYNQNYLVINRLARIIDLGRRAGLLLTIILAVIAGVVSFNTILLAIYSNKDEIGIMRLVGASNIFIRGPYIIVGIMYGISAALIGTIVSTPFIYWSSPYIAVLIPEMSLWNYFISNAFVIFGYNLLFATVIGVVSSFIVVKRYLRG